MRTDLLFVPLVDFTWQLLDFHLAQACERKGLKDSERTEYQEFLRIWNHADFDVPELVEAHQHLAELN